MSFTSNYFKHLSNKLGKIIPIKKVRRAYKKCGNCIHATLVYKKPLNGLLNEYECSEKKIKVLNCDGVCEKFENRHKKFLKPR